MSGAARDLARNVAAAIGRDPVVLTVRNLSTAGPGEAAEVRRTFETAMRAGGARMVDAPPATEVRLTLSEDLTHFVLVAEIRRGGERQVLLNSWLRSPAPSQPVTSQVSLERKLLWEQDQPILDVAQAGDGMLVLDPLRILLVRGAERQSVPVQMARPWPRDMRGRLAVSSPAFTAWLPGAVCRGNMQPQLSVECSESQEPWLLAPGAIAVFAPDRNFFGGRADIASWGARDVPPFYSAAPAGDAWVFAGTDGRARIYTRGWQEAGSIGRWGSDLAGIQTPCGARILATRPGGGPEPDAIQPYGLMEGAANPAGPALDFPGPVTALWSTGNSAVAVSHDLQTGRYAAFSLAPACGS